MSLRVLTGNAKWVWAAALIDGEGSIMFSKRTYSGNSTSTTKPNDRPHYRSVVTIANCDYRLMEALMSNMGFGQVYEHVVSNTAKSHNPRKRRQWTWRMNAGQIRLYLPKIKPWLILKEEQADLLLEACAIKDRLHAPAGMNIKNPGQRDALTSRLDEIYLAIRQANTRGRVAEGGDAK